MSASQTGAAPLPSYRITDLGLLPGEKRGSPIEASAVNGSGMVVGGCGSRPFRWTARTGMRAMKLPAGMGGNALALNESGWVAGFAGNDACVWTPRGELIRIGRLPGHKNARAMGISDDGAVAGISFGTKPFSRRGFIWRHGGTMRDAGTVSQGGAVQSGFFDVSSAGACGFTTADVTSSLIADRACVWEADRGFRILSTPHDAVQSVATGINNKGDVAGYIDTRQTGTTAALWPSDSGQAVDLGNVPGGRDFQAYAVNNAGWVLGRYYVDRARIEFLWHKSTGMRPIEELLEAASRREWTVGTANDLNEQGAFVGMCSKNGLGHAYVASPVR